MSLIKRIKKDRDMSEVRSVYLDNAATTPIRQEVLEAMMPYYSEVFGNTSSVHAWGRASRNAVETAREQVAKAIGAQNDEIYFTAGATEGDNWGVREFALANKEKGNHIITSSIEHHAVIRSCERLEKEGFQVTYLPVDEYGDISIADLESAIDDNTILVSIMMANNEIGTIMPVSEIGRVCSENNVVFHTDGVQAIGKMPVDVKKMNIDMLALSAHKFYGPKGVGVLYVRKGTRLGRMIEGGAHERGKRPGTLNHVGIIGMGRAIELATAELDEESARLTVLRDALIEKIIESIPNVKLNGHPTNRLCNNVNVSIRFIEGEALLLSLDICGIGVSSGSACSSGSLDPSHVLLGIGLSHEVAHGSIRLTLGHMNDMDDVNYTVEKLGDIVVRLRAMSPLA